VPLYLLSAAVSSDSMVLYKLGIITRILLLFVSTIIIMTHCIAS